MSIKFSDGSQDKAENWTEAMKIVKQRAKDDGVVPTEIKTTSKKGTVTVKIDEKSKKPAHADYIESVYQGWKIRVWKIEDRKVYGCNYFKGDNLNYVEVDYTHVRDQNAVFTYVISIIDDRY